MGGKGQQVTTLTEYQRGRDSRDEEITQLKAKVIASEKQLVLKERECKALRTLYRDERRNAQPDASRNWISNYNAETEAHIKAAAGGEMWYCPRCGGKTCACNAYPEAAAGGEGK